MLEPRERVYAEKQSNEWVPSQTQRMCVKEKEREEEKRCNDQSAMLFPFSAYWTRLEGPPSRCQMQFAFQVSEKQRH